MHLDSGTQAATHCILPRQCECVSHTVQTPSVPCQLQLSSVHPLPAETQTYPLYRQLNLMSRQGKVLHRHGKTETVKMLLLIR